MFYCVKSKCCERHASLCCASEVKLPFTHWLGCECNRLFTLLTFTTYTPLGAEMKIVALKVQPIARTLAIIYAVFGLIFWITFCISGVEYITLPIGMIAPLLHLNFNFNFHRSNDPVYNILLLLGSLASYALSGWLTAAAGRAALTVRLSLWGNSYEMNPPDDEWRKIAI